MASSQTSISSNTKAMSKSSSKEDVKVDDKFDYPYSETEPARDRKFERRTMLHVDLRVLPLLALLYAFALIDRINLGAAFVAGMGTDLALDVGARYSIATCLYFPPYILFQLPGNLVLRRLGVRNWITLTVVGWGAVQLGMGFVDSWQALTVTRALLGAFEAAFFPGMVFLISTWYKRHEVQKRLAAFYLISITMSGVSPILAWALSLLDGRRGIAGWRWIFIIEGAITLFLALLCWFGIADFPHNNKFLSAEQTTLILKRIDEDRGDAVPDELTMTKLWKYLRDWKLWAYGVMFVCTTLPAYAQAYFISIILNGMGYDRTKSLLLSAPPYGPPILTCMLFSWLSDKYKHRSGFIIMQTIICLIGLILTAFAEQNRIRYLGTFLTNAGNVGTIPGILAWSSNNVVSHSKRTVQSAMTVMLGGIGGILASTTFRTQDRPRYLPGLAVSIGSQLLLLVMTVTMLLYNHRMNQRSREGKLKGSIEGQPGFFYTL